MSSWVVCQCGHHLHKNLFCGSKHSVVISEEFLDQEFGDRSADDLVDGIVLMSRLAITCGMCRRLHIIDERARTAITYVEQPA